MNYSMEVINLANKKANFYVDEEIMQAIDDICQARTLGGRGVLIKELVEKYIEGEILQSHFEKEVLSLLRQHKKMLNELMESQFILLNVINTICEINDYDNFISMDEKKSFAITEAENHGLIRKNAEIVKHLEDKKAGRS